MKTLSHFKDVMFAALFISLLISCQDKQEKAEDAETEKVGEVYDADQQGVQHENRDNQFPESRNDNKEGNGLETGAPTDTIDGDGDKKVNQ